MKTTDVCMLKSVGILNAAQVGWLELTSLSVYEHESYYIKHQPYSSIIWAFIAAEKRFLQGRGQWLEPTVWLPFWTWIDPAGYKFSRPGKATIHTDCSWDIHAELLNRFEAGHVFMANESPIEFASMWEIHRCCRFGFLWILRVLKNYQKILSTICSCSCAHRAEYA